MKILHVNSYYIGSSLYKNFFDKQINQNLDIDVFVPAPVTFDSANIREAKYTKISANFTKYDRFLFQLKHNKIYKDILQKYNIRDYSIIHAHSLFSNGYIAMRLKQQFGIPFIVAVRNTDVNTFFKYMVHLRKIGVEILKEASKIIFISEPYRNFIIEKYVPSKYKEELLNKSEVIPNGIDDYWFYNKGVTKKREEHREIKLLYVGAINKNKNILTTIKAIEILIKKGFNVTFTLVGKIGDNSIYKKIIKLPYVTYLEPRPKEDLIKIYRQNDIFVMPSKHETFGLVYAEAMSQGVPVIYSKGQGFDMQFEEGLIGYSVESLDYRSIAIKIKQIVERYDEISKSCIDNLDLFNWGSIERRYNKIYHDIARRWRQNGY